MDKFLDRCKLPRQMQEEWNNLNRSILSTEIEVLNIYYLTKTSGQYGFTSEFYQILREEFFYQFFKNSSKNKKTPPFDSFY